MADDLPYFLYKQKKKGLAGTILLTLISTGRRGGIRTRDPLHPMQVRYQAALHAEALYYSAVGVNLLFVLLRFAE